jgi:hypothetical protein
LRAVAAHGRLIVLLQSAKVATADSRYAAK